MVVYKYFFLYFWGLWIILLEGYVQVHKEYGKEMHSLFFLHTTQQFYKTKATPISSTKKMYRKCRLPILLIFNFAVILLENGLNPIMRL